MTVPSCHPNKKHVARGLCANCYNKWLRTTNISYKNKSDEQARQARKTVKGKLRVQNSTLKRRYGISLEERNTIAKNQNYICKLCPNTKRLVVEHCHSTGRIRGLVCDGCNTMIGFVENHFRKLPEVMQHIWGPTSFVRPKSETLMDIFYSLKEQS